MPAASPLKSILKKPSTSGENPTAPSKSTTIRAPPNSSSDRRSAPSSSQSTVRTSTDSTTVTTPTGRRKPTPEEAREIALYHANLIQNRKNLELSILYSIELLLDFPNAPTPGASLRPASNPLRSDILTFKENLVHFTPSDYDDLIEERNIIEKCGYALCSNPRKLQPTKAKFRILDGARRIVETKKLEKFCGDECARRGLWIRVQLSEEPAWDRRGVDGQVGEGGAGNQITLLEENKTQIEAEQGGKQEITKLLEQLQGLGITGTGLPENINGLEKGVNSDDDNSLVRIIERTPTSSSTDPASTPSPAIRIYSEGGDEHITAKVAALAIEGYTPHGDNKDLGMKWKESVKSITKWEKEDDDDDPLNI